MLLLIFFTRTNSSAMRTPTLTKEWKTQTTRKTYSVISFRSKPSEMKNQRKTSWRTGTCRVSRRSRMSSLINWRVKTIKWSGRNSDWVGLRIHCWNTRKALKGRKVWRRRCFWKGWGGNDRMNFMLINKYILYWFTDGKVSTILFISKITIKHFKWPSLLQIGRNSRRPSSTPPPRNCSSASFPSIAWLTDPLCILAPSLLSASEPTKFLPFWKTKKTLPPWWWWGSRKPQLHNPTCWRGTARTFLRLGWNIWVT